MHRITEFAMNVVLAAFVQFALFLRNHNLVVGTHFRSVLRNAFLRFRLAFDISFPTTSFYRFVVNYFTRTYNSPHFVLYSGEVSEAIPFSRAPAARYLFSQLIHSDFFRRIGAAYAAPAYVAPSAVERFADLVRAVSGPFASNHYVGQISEDGFIGMSAQEVERMVTPNVV